MVDQGCQVNMFSESKLRDTTFICIRLIYSDHCETEIQVDIATTSRILMTNNSRKKDKSCCTDKNRMRINLPKQKAKNLLVFHQ